MIECNILDTFQKQKDILMRESVSTLDTSEHRKKAKSTGYLFNLPGHWLT